MADVLTTARRTPYRTSGRWIAGLIVIGAAVMTIVPLVWMIFISLQKPRVIISMGWGAEFALDNFKEIFDPRAVFGGQVINSIILVMSATTITLVISALAGYSLSQLRWSNRFVVIVLSASALLQVIPPMTLVPGLYATLSNYGLVNSLGGLILLNTVFNLPFATIMTKFYFDTIPGELRESAAIDGASEFGAFRTVMLPLAAPGIAAVAIFTAIQVWNEFLFGLVFTTGGSQSPITVGIAALVQPQEIKFGAMAAVGVVTAVPIIILAIVANRQIVAGLTGGAVKG